MHSHASRRARVLPLRPGAASPTEAAKEPLWRHVVGGVLRRERLAQERTLRDVADAARISMPYLSELERGRKEASSEILAAAAGALGLRLTDLLGLVQGELAGLSQPGDRAAGRRGRGVRPGVRDTAAEGTCANGRPAPAERPAAADEAAEPATASLPATGLGARGTRRADHAAQPARAASTPLTALPGAPAALSTGVPAAVSSLQARRPRPAAPHPGEVRLAA